MSEEMEAQAALMQLANAATASMDIEALQRENARLRDLLVLQEELLDPVKTRVDALRAQVADIESQIDLERESTNDASKVRALQKRKSRLKGKIYDVKKRAKLPNMLEAPSRSDYFEPDHDFPKSSLPELQELFKLIEKIPIQQWPVVCMQWIRVVQTSNWVVQGAPAHKMFVSSTHQPLTSPNNVEESRAWTIQIKNPNNKEGWKDILYVAPSTYVNPLRDGAARRHAGLGLFAARNFAEDEPIGFFLGQVKFRTSIARKVNDSPYALFTTGPNRQSYTKAATGHSRRPKGSGYLIEPSPKRESPYNNAFFGLHFANDPMLFMDKSVEHDGRFPSYNVFVSWQLVATAQEDISAGDELFLSYNLSPK